ncbi:hypothetical protein FHS18_006004 [Paenibacillus phyllosphaerae]|uniref:Uncharacterized protein n=1 Tax=Paenibacillus phyllosphaerae TaxID=274593 RepID=A0A7W5B488_9BACL|nr:hypothetical protein [Paenibacillus phyllosphaerae]
MNNITDNQTIHSSNSVVIENGALCHAYLLLFAANHMPLVTLRVVLSLAILTTRKGTMYKLR